jgi:hypothetical protein
MGASPALGNQVATLREIQNDPRFVLCGLSCNLEFLLNNDIQPKYCITVDAEESQGVFWEKMDMSKTRDIVLIANTFAYPPMLLKWQGPLFFLALQTADKKMRAKHRRWYGPLNGDGQEFHSLMGQFNVMAAFAFLCLGCRILLFVGNEMSFKDNSARYYVDRDDPRDKEIKGPHGDIYGNMVYTTPGLMALKIALEQYLELLQGAGYFINCTESGIFGVTKRYPGRRIPWIHQMTLKNGIAQARNIMRTGEPLYGFSPNSTILKPTLSQRVKLGNLKLAV